MSEQDPASFEDDESPLFKALELVIKHELEAQLSLEREPELIPGFIADEILRAFDVTWREGGSH